MKINNIPDEQLESQLKYLKLLSKQYPSISSASAEIINLEAILSLPKGTEHFLSDLHGEYEPFVHVLKNGSGVIKRKIEELFGNIVSEAERKKGGAAIAIIDPAFSEFGGCPFGKSRYDNFGRSFFRAR